MEYTFLFHGGPLDGNAVHGPNQDVLRFGPNAYEDSNGGEIGRQFRLGLL